MSCEKSSWNTFPRLMPSSPQTRMRHVRLIDTNSSRLVQSAVIGFIHYDSRTMKSATEVIATDLDLLSHQLRAEFDALSGRSVLIAGGGGFLGYYLVQAALHWNRHAAGTGDRRHRVRQLHSRRPAWSMALRAAPEPAC